MRAVVIGMGGVGSAAARFLALDGHQVVALEQFQIDHDRGSSYGGSRIFRMAYVDPIYTRLMQFAMPLWEQLERDAGEELLLRCGALAFGRIARSAIADTEEAFRSLGVTYERWDGDDPELRRRFPQFHFDGDRRVLFQPDQSGLARASSCVRANARLAVGLGVDLRENTIAEAIGPASDGIRVRLSSGEILVTDCIVLTAGPWLSRFAPALAANLRVTRQTYVHLRLQPDAPSMRPEVCPVWLDMDDHFYGFPEHDELPGAKVGGRGPDGAKVAWHYPFETVDPDDVDRELHDRDIRPVLDYAKERLPGLSGDVTYWKVCLYTNTPDADFIVDRLPADPRIAVVGGLSGHGFKFTVALGRIAANLAQGRDPGFDLSRFAISRFGS